LNHTCERALAAQYSRVRARREAAEKADRQGDANSRANIVYPDTSHPLALFYEHLSHSNESGAPLNEDNSVENMAHFAHMAQLFLN